jgi:hypothetical protein
MLIEESRVFQVATFGTLHLHRSELDEKHVLLDAMVIADICCQCYSRFLLTSPHPD